MMQHNMKKRRTHVITDSRPTCVVPNNRPTRSHQNNRPTRTVSMTAASTAQISDTADPIQANRTTRIFYSIPTRNYG